MWSQLASKLCKKIIKPNKSDDLFLFSLKPIALDKQYPCDGNIELLRLNETFYCPR